MKLTRRIALSMLPVVAISGGVCSLVGGYLLWRGLRREAQSRVRQDLNAAREFYDQRLEAMASALRLTVLGERFSEATAAGQVGYLGVRLAALRKLAGLDVLYAADAQGRVIHRAHRPAASGDSVLGDRLVRSVLTDGQTVSGTILVPVEELAKEDVALADRARVRILPTPKARPTEATELDGGMMLCAAAPVHGPDGELAGVLRAGVLLSRNYELVDQVQNTVFRGERYRGKPLGNATIFQYDVRISTNVLREDGSRAIGTRVSADVHDQVLRQGRAWLGRAWVVNDWYVSAYEPIQDLDGRPIGMLYVGVLQRRFDDAALGTLATFGLVTTAGLLVAWLLAWKLAATISGPVRALARASQSIAKGDFSGTVEAPPRWSDEIGALAHTFNEMARSLHERDELLKQRTRIQLTRSERLAAVGRLAAGVAHEINNPLTGVLTFSHMMLRDAPPGSQAREDLQAIIDATTRCRDITRGLLNFSRQGEPEKVVADLNDVAREALNLTRNQAHLNQIVVAEELAENVRDLVIDPNQIQEVAVNVILNAIDAMAGGGTLTVRTRPADGGAWAELEIADTGCGIPQADLDHIFDPFFTTKPPGKGTGLGLAISYGIVMEHGGDIGVRSGPGRGTTVTIRLPAAMKEPSDEREGADPGR